MSKPLLLVLLLAFSCLISKGTHIVGGELNYEYLGANNYQISLTIYRDCGSSSNAGFDDPAAIGIFNSNNEWVKTLFINLGSTITLPPAINSPCLIPPTNVCYEVTTYSTTTNLPPTPGGYQISYQRCCRNGTILNLVNPLEVGATFYASIPDTSLASTNSNPVFNALPPSFLCSDIPFSFNHSATDPDGDSLVYELVTPFEGASQTDPRPQPPNNPPYSLVNWLPSFSVNDMLDGDKALEINKFNGLLTAEPGPMGQYVIGIKVSEYRNGKFLSSTTRDFQFNIVACENLTVAALQTPNFSCDSYTASFENNSVNAGFYKWDFGDSSTLNDTSHLATPSYTYPDTGIYNVRLVAYSAINPACNDTSFGQVVIYPEFKLTTSYTNDICSQTVQFFSSTILDGDPNVIYKWNFGDPATTTDVSSIRNPTYTYSDSGNYVAKIIAFSPVNEGCNDTVDISLYAYPELTINRTINNVKCTPDVTFTASSSYDVFGNLSYFWDFGDPALTTDTTSVQNPSYSYFHTGTFNVLIKVTDDSLGCSDSIRTSLLIYPDFQASISSSIDSCSGKVDFSSTTTLYGLAVVKNSWNFGDPTTTTDVSAIWNPSYTYPESGNYMVNLIAYAPALVGCDDTVNLPLHAFMNFNQSSSISNVPCTDELVYSGSSSYDGAYVVNYFWDFGDSLLSVDTSTKPNGSFFYTNFGIHEVSLIANSVSPFCADTQRMEITIYPEFILDTTIFNKQCTQRVDFNAESTLDDLLDVNYFWDFGDILSTSDTSNKSDTFYVYPDSGVYHSKVIAYTTEFNTCADSIAFDHRVFLELILNAQLTTTDCSPLVYFTSNSNYDGLYSTNYTWDFDETNLSEDTSSLSTINYAYKSPGLHTPSVILSVDTPACSDTTYLSVRVFPDFELEYSLIEALCDYSIHFSASSSIDGLTNVDYFWTFGDGKSSDKAIINHDYGKEGSYNISLHIKTGNGCIDSVFTIAERGYVSEIFIPTAFTPNGDGENDVFFVRGTLDQMNLAIYNRWGEKVFETDDQTQGWDGTYKGNPSELGVFVFHLKTKCGDKEEEFRQGNITLIR